MAGIKANKVRVLFNLLLFLKNKVLNFWQDCMHWRKGMKFFKEYDIDFYSKEEIWSEIQWTTAYFLYRYFYWEILLRFKTAAECIQWNGKSLYSYKRIRNGNRLKHPIQWFLQNLQKLSKKRTTTYTTTERESSPLVLSSRKGCERVQPLVPSCYVSTLLWVSEVHMQKFQ